MSFTQIAGSYVRSFALAAAPAAVFVSGVREGLVPLEYDEPRFAVNGTLLIDGRPVSGVEVRLHALPVEGLTPAPSAVTRDDGGFSLRTNAWQDGVAAGEYRVTVVWRPNTIQGEDYRPGPNLLAGEYAKAATTPLRVTVRPGDNALHLGDIPCSGRQG